jgi:hypothetical protein
MPIFSLISHDCGVFTMKSVEVFDPTKDLRKEFSKDDVLHLRIQYANRLFFHSGNTVDRSIVTNYYVKVTFFLHFSLTHYLSVDEADRTLIHFIFVFLGGFCAPASLM